MKFSGFLISEKRLLIVSKIFSIAWLFSSILSSVDSFASPRKSVEVSVHSADSLATSILRDNYDAWAEEIGKREILASENRLAEIDLRSEELDRKEKIISREIKNKLESLASQQKPDRASLRALLFLAMRSEGSERSKYYARLMQLLPTVQLSAIESLRIHLLVSTHLLFQARYEQSLPLLEKASSLAGLPELQGRQERCLAPTLFGDVFFQLGEYGRAVDQYLQGDSCVSDFGKSWQTFNRSLLTLRLTWANYRLTRYKSVLDFLSRGIQEKGLLSVSENPAISSDLAVMLGVALSEESPASLPSQWEHASVHAVWVAWGLAKAVNYLVQKEQNRDALRWFVSLEETLSRTGAAEEFFRSGLAAAEALGLLDQVENIKFKALKALGVRGHYSRLLRGRESDDLKRREWVLELSRDYISLQMAKSSERLDDAALRQLVHSVDVFLEENPDLCREATTLRDAHAILSRARMVSRSERLFSELQSCADDVALQERIRLARLEMFEQIAREERPAGLSTNRYLEELKKELERSDALRDVRRMGFDAIGDAIQSQRDSDSEILLKQLLATGSQKGEEAAFERVLFVNSIVSMLARRPQSEQVVAMAVLILKDIRGVLGAQEPSLLLLESALAAAYLQKVLSLKMHGRLQEAVKVALDGVTELKTSSAAGRSLAFSAARVACAASLRQLCLEASALVLGDNRFSSHERSYVGFLRGDALYDAGGFIAAAEHWLLSSERAVGLQSDELVVLAKERLIRAGAVFSELKVWRQTVRVRELGESLVSVGPLDQQLRASLVEWSGRALLAGSADVALSLSQGLANNADRKRPSSFTDAAAKFLAAAASARLKIVSGSEFEPVLFEFLELTSRREFMDSARFSLLGRSVPKMISAIYPEWHREVFERAEGLTRQRDNEDFASVPEQLDRHHAALVRGCSLLLKSPAVDLLKSELCGRDVTPSFLSLYERFRGRVNSVFASNSVEFSKLDKKLLQLESRIKSRLSGRVGIVNPAAAPSFTVLDRSPLEAMLTGGRR
jgi:tetratricopeptide (TPR) repeat protein